MNIINNYCNNLKSKYLNTKKVIEQIEEIRDTIHIKTEEYQEKGYKYQDAAKEAIKSLGDVTSLFEELTTATKLVYQDRLVLLSNISSTLIVSFLTLIMWILSITVAHFYSISKTAPTGILLTAFSFIVVWAVKFNEMRHLNKKVVVEINNKEKYKDIRNSIIGIIIIAITAIIMNIYTSISSIWFVWAIIGVSNWLITTLIYYKLLNSTKFDVD